MTAVARVLGIGGVFLRSPDPEALAAWYALALGVDFDATPAATFASQGTDEYGVLGLFDATSTYIGDPQRQSVMLNLRVEDLEGVLERLSSVGAPTEDIADEVYGRFSWTYDLDGNRIELWEPSSATSD
jgi:predicted enzyme related to lactoylglutathione lyase